MRSGWASPYVWVNPIRTEVITIGPSHALSSDLEGKELWRLSGMAPTPVPSPFSVDGMPFGDAGRGRPLYAVKPGTTGEISLEKGAKSNGYVVWSENRGGTYLPTPVAYQGGNLCPRNFTSSLWAYNSKIFCLNSERKTFVGAVVENS